jgi:hypothetical protein
MECEKKRKERCRRSDAACAEDIDIRGSKNRQKSLGFVESIAALASSIDR